MLEMGVSQDYGMEDTEVFSADPYRSETLFRPTLVKIEGNRVSAEYRADAVAIGLFALHCAIIAFVLLGWQMPSRAALLVYLVALPMIGLQWLLNGGSSIVNNGESLLRRGRWHDPDNIWEGAFFGTLLHKTLGLEVRPAQLNLVIGFTMAFLWLSALFHLMLIRA